MQVLVAVAGPDPLPPSRVAVAVYAAEFVFGLAAVALVKRAQKMPSPANPKARRT